MVKFVFLKPETISDAKAVELDAWLSEPECNTLIEIASSNLRTHLLSSMEGAMDAMSQKNDLKFGSADTGLLKANRYQVFLEVLQEIKSHKGKRQTNKFV